jgi:hypothetical protein
LASSIPFSSPPPLFLLLPEDMTGLFFEVTRRATRISSRDVLCIGK